MRLCIVALVLLTSCKFDAHNSRFNEAYEAGTSYLQGAEARAADFDRRLESIDRHIDNIERLTAEIQAKNDHIAAMFGDGGTW